MPTNRVIVLQEADGEWIVAYEAEGDSLDTIKPEHRNAVAMLDAAGASAQAHEYSINIDGVGVCFCYKSAQYMLLNYYLDHV